MRNNVQTGRFCLLILLAMMFGKISAQNPQGIPLNKNNCLFGYISDNPKEFEDVVNYMTVLNLKVISICEEEYLIYIELNERYKDYTVLFAKIEKRFTGTCYHKSQENEIPLYSKCREQYIKETAKN
jgi:hypothetical protein